MYSFERALFFAAFHLVNVDELDIGKLKPSREISESITGHGRHGRLPASDTLPVRQMYQRSCASLLYRLDGCEG